MSSQMLEFRVLIVEDDESVKEKVAKRLRCHFSEVYEAKDGLEGWALYCQNKPDILFLDINLPKLSGLELLKKIRKIDQNTKAIMLTAHSDLQTLLQASELKLSKYIIKPLNREILQKSIELVVSEIQSFRTIPLKNLYLKEGFVWNMEQKELYCNAKALTLTPTERKIFDILARNANRILYYSDIILYVWDSFDTDKKEALKTSIKTLRKKLPKNSIQNIYGEGFTLTI